jgi:hypothetical protein
LNSEPLEVVIDTQLERAVLRSPDHGMRFRAFFVIYHYSSNVQRPDSDIEWRLVRYAIV